MTGNRNEPLPADLARPLAGRVVLVTGGGRGIGRAVALGAAARGASVAVGFRQRASDAAEVVAMARNLGADADARPADVSVKAEATSLVEWAEERFGRVDGLVNSAGSMHSAPSLEVNEADWDRVLRANLSSAMFVTQAVLAGMLKRGRGSIVMLSSRAGQIGWAEVAAYSAAKAGLIGLTKSLAREYAPRGIRINAVAPGPTNTDMTRNSTGPNGIRRAMETLPLGRFGEPDEVASAILFLISDEAILFHGQTLNPNSGGYMP